jgi:hypothetical protein
LKRSLLLSLLCALALAGCDEEPITEPLPPLDPVSRVAALAWTVADDAQAADWNDLADAVESYGPTVVMLGGELEPQLDLDGGQATTVAVAMLAAELEARELVTRIGVELGALGVAAPDEICFDPEQPTSDPYLLARADAWRGFLEANPAVVDAAIDLAATPAPWDVSCTCTPCDDASEAGQALRLAAAFAALEAGADDYGRGSWWWDSLTWPGMGVVEVDAVMDRALTEVRTESSLRVRASIDRGASHIWAAENPRLVEGLSREVAADLDLVAGAFGPTDVPLVFVDDLHDRVQRNRSRGILAWFAAIDGGGRTPWGRPEEANVYFSERLFRNLESSPDALLEGWIIERYGLTPDGEQGLALFDALRNTGRSMSLVTHPLGIPVAGIDGGIVGIPLSFVDPRHWEPAWQERWTSLTAPTLQTLIDVNQWGAEGVGLAEASMDAFEEVQGGLSTADAADLRSRLTLLIFATQAWKLTLGADLALKLREADPVEGLDDWLRQDAQEMDVLADELDAALAAGLITDPFPADATVLRAIAQQIRDAVGAGEKVERPFPTITEVVWSFAEGQTNVHWTLRPGGSSWWERGPGWPQPFDVASEIGEGPSVFWHAYTHLDAGERVVFRPCGSSEGYTVCASDNVLWTPL